MTSAENWATLQLSSHVLLSFQQFSGQNFLSLTAFAYKNVFCKYSWDLIFPCVRTCFRVVQLAIDFSCFLNVVLSQKMLMGKFRINNNECSMSWLILCISAVLAHCFNTIPSLNQFTVFPSQILLTLADTIPKCMTSNMSPFDLVSFYLFKHISWWKQSLCCCQFISLVQNHWTTFGRHQQIMEHYVFSSLTDLIYCISSLVYFVLLDVGRRFATGLYLCYNLHCYVLP